MKDENQVSEDLAAKVAKTTNRVTLEYLRSRIKSAEFITIAPMVIAIVTHVNGFKVVETAAAADIKNFDVELGKHFAMQKVERRLWELEGFLLCEKLAQ